MASGRRSTDPFETVLKRRLKGAPLSDAADCPASEILAAYYDRSLSRSERTRVDAHLTSCVRCQSMMASIARADEDGLTPASRGIFWITRVLAPVAAIGIVFVVAISMRTRRQPVPELIALASPVPVRPELAERAATPPPEVAAKAQLQKQIPGAPPPAGIVESPRAEVTAHHHRATERLMAPVANSSSKRLESPAAALQTVPAAPANVMARGVGGGSASASSPAKTSEIATENSASQPATTAASIASGAASTIQEQAASAPAAMVAQAPSVAARSVSGASETAAKAPRTNWISSPDGSVRWQFGQDGTILRATNSGAALMTSGVTTDLLGASAPSNEVCWLVGKSGTVLRTLDSGAHWQLLRPPSRDNFTAVSASDSNNATLFSSSGIRFLTHDGGATWSAQ